MPLNITVDKKEEQVFLVTLVGEINTETYADLEDEVQPIITASVKAIVFDMAGVSYISSMGLSAIFKIKQSIEEYNGTIAITNLQPQVKKVFEIIKVLPEHYFSTMQEAEHYLDDFLSDMQRKEIDKRKESS